jgi:hypothetical protein
MEAVVVDIIDGLIISIIISFIVSGMLLLFIILMFRYIKKIKSRIEHQEKIFSLFLMNNKVIPDNSDSKLLDKIDEANNVAKKTNKKKLPEECKNTLILE